MSFGDYMYIPHSGVETAPVLDRHRTIAATDNPRRRIVALDPGAGALLIDAHDTAPATSRTFQWISNTRAGTAELIGLMDWMLGRADVFWMPSYQHDLVLTANAAAGASTITVQWIGYTARLFPPGMARRHLCFMAPGGALSFAQVASTVDNGNGTETLTFEDPLTDPLTAGQTMVSFLRYVRLEEDELEIELRGTDVAVCTFSVRELPLEVPA